MSLGRTTYIGPQHVLNTALGAEKTTVDSNGTLVVLEPFSLPLPSAVSCPHDGYRLTTVGDNLTWATTNGLLVGSGHVPEPVKTTYLNHSFGGDLSLMTEFTLVGSGGEGFVRAKAELDCVVPPRSPNVAIGWNNVSVMMWPPTDMSNRFGLNTQIALVEHDGNNLTWSPMSSAPSIAMN